MYWDFLRSGNYIYVCIHTNTHTHTHTHIYTHTHTTSFLKYGIVYIYIESFLLKCYLLFKDECRQIELTNIFKYYLNLSTEIDNQMEKRLNLLFDPKIKFSIF